MSLHQIQSYLMNLQKKALLMLQLADLLHQKEVLLLTLD